MSPSSNPTLRHLLSPCTLGSLELANRMMMAPMTRSRAGAARMPGDMHTRYYLQRRTAGLIVSEALQISQQAIGYIGTPGIHTDEQERAWRRVVSAVHEGGGTIFAQLWHAGRVSARAFQPAGAAPVAPSAIAAPGETYTDTGPVPFDMPRALETSEIPAIVQQFADAARRARAAGFDGVEIHGGSGYLIDQFLRDSANVRTDSYGGSAENRVRILLEVISAVRKECPIDRIGVRISPTVPFIGVSDSNPERTFRVVAEALSDFDLGYLHVIEPIADSALVSKADVPRVTPIIREHFRGRLVLNGGYDAASAEGALARGEGDLVSFGALFVSNPDLPARFASGAPLSPPDRATFYGGGEQGYTDYPALA
ncbi:NADH:flavin oxidoreductase, Old Yellow Enzyme family [Labilithrix luteola]|uniref:NADH:flavin oxidoreductase, Old Yellow Enzyme family n=1 Tax=Labilithrix luteola TaxID=1391654 RepID=A0A0K1PJJ7_9BACT|nr:alkene reductase [Labilithrix luteola]AKU93586.1 NADH:flavin oxidoreductase, Old Yellow Enzyme family [Labilithrix luteola]